MCSLYLLSSQTSVPSSYFLDLLVCLDLRPKEHCLRFIWKKSLLGYTGPNTLQNSPLFFTYRSHMKTQTLEFTLKIQMASHKFYFSNQFFESLIQCVFIIFNPSPSNFLSSTPTYLPQKFMFFFKPIDFNLCCPITLGCIYWLLNLLSLTEVTLLK